MDKLLKYWNSKIKSDPGERTIWQRNLKEPSSVIRRLTTTISRSVKIQTDFDEKSFEDKGVVTDGKRKYGENIQIIY